MDSIASWLDACREYQRRSDSRRIDETNRRSLRTERAWLTAALVVFIILFSIFFR